MKDFGTETNVFLLDTSELDMTKTMDRGLRGREFGGLPSIGELEAWFIFECPVAIELVGVGKVIEAACEEFKAEYDIMEALLMLIISKLKYSKNRKSGALFESLSGKE